MCAHILTYALVRGLRLGVVADKQAIIAMEYLRSADPEYAERMQTYMNTHPHTHIHLLGVRSFLLEW